MCANLLQKLYQKDTIECHLSLDDASPLGIICHRGYLRRLLWFHNRFGCRFTLYLFAKDIHGKEFVPEEKKPEFVSCTKWISFGFHGIETDASINEFQEAYGKVKHFCENITGGKGLASIVRLHRFKGREEVVCFLKRNKARVLLTADDERVSYDLTEEENQILLKEGQLSKADMEYWRTDIRLEKKSWYWDTVNAIKRKKRVVIFSHEPMLVKWRYFFLWARLYIILKKMERKYNVHYL